MKRLELNRRRFLRGTFGATMALPFLETFGAEKLAGLTPVPKRMVCVGFEYSFVPDLLFPTEEGRDYDMTPLLRPLALHRDDFSLFAGLDHGITGGHLSVHSFLSGILAKDASNMLEGNVSVDQKAAMTVGAKTRYSSMQFSPGSNGNHLISWTAGGAPVPPIDKLQTIFDLLFRPLELTERQKAERSIDGNQSILDLVKNDANALMRRVSKSDQEKLDQYFTSVREVERKLTMSKAWLDRPKPRVSYELPNGADSMTYKERVPLLYDLMVLALQTDSTRVISMAHGGLGANSGGFPISKGYHTLTHHGKIPEKLRQLSIVETFHTTHFARYLDKLRDVKEPNGKTLLDNTINLMGSGLGNASSHSNRDLPLLLAGGGFKHVGHMQVAKLPNKQSVPACNLYLSMLQRFGLEIDSFNTSSGTLTGLDLS